MFRFFSRCLLLLLPLLLGCMLPVGAAKLAVLLPLNRVAYQTNEQIDLAIVRSDTRALAAGNLLLTLTGDDGSKLIFTFPVKAVPLEGNEARATEHLHLNGWLLRPGNYVVNAAVDGATGQTTCELYSHLRKSTFKLVDWIGTPAGPSQEVMGEDSLGFNVLLGPGKGDHTVRAGTDFMMGDTMGGGHQMDLKLECDWSDPYVLGGGRARVVRQALKDRTNGNCLGVHFYDEPGLTWIDGTPHNIPAQDRSYKSAFGVDSPKAAEVKPGSEAAARWMERGRWKEEFMEAAWRYAASGVSAVRPDFIATTQGMYGWNCYTDGYYFNIARAENVICGHGWYEDITWGYHAPAIGVEMGRIRDLQKPVWYMPTWAGTPPERFRMNQYLSFMLNIQGMMKPLPMAVYRPSLARHDAGTDLTAGVVESNKAMARLGTIFTTMPVTRPPVAVLFSLSQCLAAQVKDTSDYYDGGGHSINVQAVLVAGDLNGIPVMPVEEEDVLDGTLAAYHQAVILPKIDYLDPKVVSALESYIAHGGMVLLTDDSQVQIKGAEKLGVTVDASMIKHGSELYLAGKMAELYQQDNVANYEKIAMPLARAIAAKLAPRGITPVFACDNTGIVQHRQAFGDIEYLFAVNDSYDAEVGAKNSTRPTVATIGLPADGRPVYDAMLGGALPQFKAQGKLLSGQFRFGVGQMRVFARTTRPIGGVQVASPTLFRDYTVANAPLHLDVTASLVDEQQTLLSGSAPMEIKLLDPLGVTRYDLYRATDHGVLKESLPLAANDPAGTWTVVVTELLSNKAGHACWSYTPPAQCGALAGATQRAVYFGNDWEHINKFFRTQQDVTIVRGSGGYNATAADRLAESLKPWGIRCTIVNAVDVAKPRQLPVEAKATWRGLQGGVDSNLPVNVGFALQGPAILLGTPADNPLIMFLQQQEFLPYVPGDDFPGRGRGYLAWQLDGIGYGQESITAIADDATGMAEAVGTLYEMAAGLAPLTPLAQPVGSDITVAMKAPAHAPALPLAWQAQLPDRAAAVKALPGGQAVVLSEDGTLTLFAANGKPVWQKTLAHGGERWALDASADGNVIAVGASQYVMVFDGKGKQLGEAPIGTFKILPTVTCLAVSDDGTRIAAAATNGCLACFNKAGKRLWTTPGVDTESLATYAPPKETPRPYFGLTFTADGTTLLAATESQAQLIASTDGKVAGSIAGSIAGINGRFPLVRAGVNLLASDGSHSVRLISLAEGKIAQQMNLPGDGIVGLAQQGDSIIAATESDDTVCQLKSLDGKLEQQRTWTQTTPCHVVKKLLAGNGFTVLIYWGGLITVQDTTGTVVATQTLPQDVADAALTGSTLIAGLADGRVWAFKVK